MTNDSRKVFAKPKARIDGFSLLQLILTVLILGLVSFGIFSCDRDSKTARLRREVNILNKKVLPEVEYLLNLANTVRRINLSDYIIQAKKVNEKVGAYRFKTLCAAAAYSQFQIALISLEVGMNAFNNDEVYGASNMLDETNRRLKEAKVIIKTSTMLPYKCSRIVKKDDDTGKLYDEISN